MNDMVEPGRGDGDNESALFAEWAGLVLGDREAAPDDVTLARRAVKTLADDLLRGDDPGRARALAEWPAAGLLQAIMASTDMAPLIDALAAVAAPDPVLRSRLRGVVAEATEGVVNTVDNPAEVLAPGGIVARLLLACNQSGAAGRYVDELTSSLAADSSTNVESAVLGGPAVPSALTQVCAVLHDTVERRFGNFVANELVGGHLFTHLIGPKVGAAGATARGEWLSDPAAEPELHSSVRWFSQQIVAAGRWAASLGADGEDPDDPVVLRGAALEDEDALVATFALPTPPDPLGTMPALALDALGVAIRRVRTQRSLDYDWGAVSALAEDDPEAFDLLVTDERCQVLDLLLP